MLETIEIRDGSLTVEELMADIERVCRRIPPLWDLNNYVAVNPFLGYSGSPIDEAAQEVGDGLAAKVLPDVQDYRARWAAGEFHLSDLARAALESDFSVEVLSEILDGRRQPPVRPASPVLTFAERVDRDSGSQWEDALIRQITRWCAVHMMKGGSYWTLSDGDRGLYASWREAASVDRTLEIFGLTGWRRWAASLPSSADETIVQMMVRLNIEPEDRERYLYRLLKGVYGWASYLRREGWSGLDDSAGSVTDLLAIRIGADAAVAELTPRTGRRAKTPLACREEVEDESIRVVFQNAWENGFVRRLLGGLRPPPPEIRPQERPAVQAVFCIDVRSEPLRRHLEAQSEAIETRGFAGFFGVAIDWQSADGVGSARCPVLLKPTVSLRDSSPYSPGVLASASGRVSSAPAGAFNFVELLGLAYGLGLAADAMSLGKLERSKEHIAPLPWNPVENHGAIEPETRHALALGILKNMGLRHTFARLVLLTGHESHSANNPHAAGLDCGACGGHGGALNARVASAILNDPAVRQGLRPLGWDLPADTVFVAGVHDTSTDSVTLLDTDRIPDSHRADLDRLRVWLDRAGSQVRAERAPALGLKGQATGVLKRLLRAELGTGRRSGPSGASLGTPRSSPRAAPAPAG